MDPFKECIINLCPSMCINITLFSIFDFPNIIVNGHSVKCDPTLHFAMIKCNGHDLKMSNRVKWELKQRNREQERKRKII